MKEPHSISGKMMIVVVASLALFLVVNLTIQDNFVNRIEKNSVEQARHNLEQVSEQNTYLVDILLEEMVHKVQTVANVVSANIEAPQENLVEQMKNLVGVAGFYNLGLVNPEGICYTTTNERLDLSDYDYFKHGFDGKSGFTESRRSEDGQMNLNIFFMPVYKGEEVRYLLTATYRSDELSHLLNLQSYEQAGNCVVVNQDGEMLAKSLNPQQNIDWNIYDKSAQYTDEHNQLVEVLRDNEEGFFSYTYQEQSYLAYFSQLKYGNYYLVTFVPQEQVYSAIEENVELMQTTMRYVQAVVLLLLFGVFLMYLCHIRRMRYYLYRDNLTEADNFAYYRSTTPTANDPEWNNKALCVMDVDDFKLINTRYGKAVGDRVLKELYRQFTKTLPEDKIYRDQNDVFVAILCYEHTGELTEKLEKLLKAKGELVANHIIPYVHISIGIALCQGYDSVDAAFNDALIIKAGVKGNMQKSYQFATAKARKEKEETKEIEGYFQKAIQNHEFEVWYQPKYDIRTEKIVGAEALVRWRRPNGKLVPPYKFIPVYEKNGQIVELDLEVLRQTCKNIANMKLSGVRMVPISVNLSRFQVENAQLEHQICTITDQYGITPKDIQFEITETADFAKEKIQGLIEMLKSHGFEVHMDDFGTGVSGLHTLSTLAFDTAKIDKSFIDEIGKPKVNKVIQGMIHLCNSLCIKLVAEGIESKEQADFLRENGCYVVQGYYYSKPICQDEFDRLVEQGETTCQYYDAEHPASGKSFHEEG